MNDAAQQAADLLGFIREIEEPPGADGKPGKVKLEFDGDGGMTGYMVWLGLNHPASFAAILRGMMPMQVNARVEKPFEDVVYRSAEEVTLELKAAGFTDEKIDFLIEDLRMRCNPSGSAGA